jgi:6-phosphogluconolactonase
MLHIFYSDERMVPPDSPQSNYALSRPLLDALQIPKERVHPVQTELSTEAAADALNVELDHFFTAEGTIALALLGLGADGHTASLFNEADLARAVGRWASATPRKDPPDRVTLSPKTLSRADRVIFLAAGPDKVSVVHKLVNSPGEIVAGRAIAGARNVELWTA